MHIMWLCKLCSRARSSGQPPGTGLAPPPPSPRRQTRASANSSARVRAASRETGAARPGRQTTRRSSSRASRWAAPNVCHTFERGAAGRGATTGGAPPRGAAVHARARALARRPKRGGWSVAAARQNSRPIVRPDRSPQFEGGTRAPARARIVCSVFLFVRGQSHAAVGFAVWLARVARRGRGTRPDLPRSAVCGPIFCGVQRRGCDDRRLVCTRRGRGQRRHSARRASSPCA